LYVEPYEVLNLLGQIKVRKASKDVPGWLLKEGKYFIANVLQHIINTMISQSKFPNCWKLANVTPVEKKKPTTSINDFRPLCITNLASKICEKVISQFYRREITVFEDQYAYVKNGGTTVALISMIDEWTRSLDRKEVIAVRVLLLDMTKAFNRMDHTKMITKMKHENASTSLTSLCQNYLTGRQQRVIFKNCQSGFLPMKCGVPQGTVMGPLLWNTYVNDLKVYTGKIFKYADDITVFQSVDAADLEIWIKENGYAEVALEKDAIGQSIKEIAEWCQQNNMALALNKSRHMTIQLNKKRCCRIYSDEVQESEGVEKFLGIYIDNKLTFITQVNHVVSKAQRLIFWLRVLKSSGVGTDGLVQLYCSKIRSVLTYAAPAWITFLSEHQLLRLEKVERTAMKIIFPEMQYAVALQLAKINSLRVFCGKLIQQLFSKVVNNPCHPLHCKLPTKSSRKTRITSGNLRFIHEKCNTVKRANSFLPWCTRRYDGHEHWQL
jgi:hypothetical protein